MGQDISWAGQKQIACFTCSGVETPELDVCVDEQNILCETDVRICSGMSR